MSTRRPIITLVCAGLVGCHPAAASPAALAAPVAAVPRPSDPAAAVASVVYTGNLPRPAPQLRYPASHELTEPAPTAAQRQSWNALVRYVAGEASRARRDSALLVRGSTLANPRWIACGDKPRAALVDLEAVVGAGQHVSGATGAALAAIETIGVTIVYATARVGPDLPPVLAALTRAGLRAPMPDTTLLTMLPGRESAVRAAAGERWCVIAVAGDHGDDFPGGAAARHEGWFLVPPVAE